MLYHSKLLNHMKSVLLSLLCISISYSVFSSEAAWKLEKDKDGIKIWNRRQVNSNLKEYKGVVVVQSSIEKLITFFRNYKMYEKWMYKVDEGSAKLIKKVSDDEFYVRVTMSAPLIKSRESVTHFTINKPDAKGVVMVNLETTPDLIPLNRDFVRIPKMKGYWKFVPLENGKVEITHQAPIIAGGYIPDAMANLGAVDAPFSMLSDLRLNLK